MWPLYSFEARSLVRMQEMIVADCGQHSHTVAVSPLLCRWQYFITNGASTQARFQVERSQFLSEWHYLVESLHTGTEMDDLTFDT